MSAIPGEPVTERQWLVGLIILITLHVAIVGLFYFDVIRDPFHPPGTFRFHHGGDENDFFALAQSLLDRAPAVSRLSIGLPLLMTPYMLVFKPATVADMVSPIAAFNALILFPAAQVLLAHLALRFTRQRAVALLSVLIWTLLPLVMYVPMALVGRGAVGATWAVHAIWGQLLTEPPTTFLTLLSFWLAFRILDTRQPRWAILLGIVCGLLLMIRINSILSIAALAVALLAGKRWKALIGTGIVALVTFLPQFVYNAYIFGSPFAIGYEVLDTAPPHGLMSAQYLLQVLNGDYGLLIAGMGGLALALLALGMYQLAKRDVLAALAVGIWLAGYLTFFSFYYYSWIGGMARFLIPAQPAAAILTAALALYLPSGQDHPLGFAKGS